MHKIISIKSLTSLVCIFSWFASLADVVITPPLGEKCSEDSIILTADAGEGEYTYTWAPATGLSSTTGSTVVASHTATISYTVTATQGETEYTDVVLVYSYDCHVTVSPSAPEICSGDSIALSLTEGSNPYTFYYTWAPSTGLNTTEGLEVIAYPMVTTTYTITSHHPITEAEYYDYVTVVVNDCSPDFPCTDCLPSFSPLPGKEYIISAWVHESDADTMSVFTAPAVKLSFTGSSTTYIMKSAGKIIDGWQRIDSVFVVPVTSTGIKIELMNTSLVSGKNVYFDDIRIHPFDANMKSFVYDPLNLRLVAELDANNFPTRYEYDEEGALIRVKKDTERGIMTIKENKNNTVKQ